ncbi:MAG: ABC transporter substrate-binding protein [Pseudomonadota bacterium]
MPAPLLAAVVLGLAPCGISAQTPQRGGTLEFGLAVEPPSYDCHAGNTFGVIFAVAPHYSTLLKVDVKNYPNVVGDLAAAWDISPDRKTYRFRLQPNVLFHDGSRLTSADVKATYQRLRDPAPGVVSVRQALFAGITSIETPDSETVVFTLDEPDAAMLSLFASPWNCIYSAARLAQDPTFPATHIMGTGPFKFVEHAKGAYWVGARNETYFRPGLPYLDGFRITFIANETAMINALQGGAIKAEFRSITPIERDRLVDTLKDQIRIEETSELTVQLLTFNVEHKPFDDPRVRRALSMAIDRWDAGRGLGRTTRNKPVGGLMRPGSAMATPEAELSQLPGFGKDPAAARAAAKRLLADAGVSNLKFTLLNRNFAPNTQSGVYIVDQWRRIGVNAEHKPVEIAQWQQALTSGTFDAVVEFGSALLDDPSFAMSKHISADRSPANYSRAIDRELDSLYDRQRRSTGPEERLDAVRQFERRLYDQAYSVPFLWTQRIVPLYREVRGWSISPSLYIGQDLADVWLDNGH